ncbi:MULTISPECIES: energy-coupling factor ABC transporter ATP-binding protein [Bacteria]|uniref:energy-coupling factor ABC transporter ATP-binding protein n=1 Tax=Bacteria TaxID=2 RepID=UPI003C7BE781
MPPEVVVSDVTVRVDGRTVLSEVSLRLGARRTAIVGANGSGKSTFVRLLNGLSEPSSGEVRVLGHDVRRERMTVRRLVGFVFANPEAQILMPTPAEDVALSVRDLPAAEAKERVAAVLDRYGLADSADVPVAELSGGQRQLLAIAAVLATDPGLVVADEPTTMLDLRNARMIGDLLIERIGVPLIIVTHDLELAARCDEAVLFDGGRVRAVGAPDDVILAYRRSCG